MRFQIRECVSPDGKPYRTVKFWCPGCAELTGNGLNYLAINTDVVEPNWELKITREIESLLLPVNRYLIEPRPKTGFTLKSDLRIQTKSGICHAYITAGRFEYFLDSTHSLSGRFVEMPDLPEWTHDLKGPGE